MFTLSIPLLTRACTAIQSKCEGRAVGRAAGAVRDSTRAILKGLGYPEFVKCVEFQIDIL